MYCFPPIYLPWRSRNSWVGTLQLEFNFGAIRRSNIIDISCLYSLTALHSMNIWCQAGHLVISSGLSKLSQLTLGISGTDAMNVPAGGLHLQVDWQAMQALEHLLLKSWRIYCT